MKIIIMGCGRVGGRLANRLDEAGHEVVVLDKDPYSFRWLFPNFKGTAMVGDGTDEDVLRKAGIENADAFVAATQGDNRNVLASQIAKHIFKVPKVVSRIYDPIRRDMYQELGLETISSTTVMADLLMDTLQR
ncbi:MAG: TrkA family potassium uptake protein [Dehalococcoidia bacterium]